MARVGVDVGGTNTDLVLESDRGVFVHKVQSTPQDQSEGVLKGLSELCEMAGVSPGDVDLIVHGTTIATNITIEHNGADVGMITSRNFRDILHMGRHKRPHNFSLHFEVPWQNRPLVKRRNRVAVTERILPPDGRIDTPLDESQVLDAIKLFKKRGLKSVVIGFMFSFLNPAHEQRVGQVRSDARRRLLAASHVPPHAPPQAEHGRDEQQPLRSYEVEQLERLAHARLRRSERRWSGSWAPCGDWWRRSRYG